MNTEDQSLDEEETSRDLTAFEYWGSLLDGKAIPGIRDLEAAQLDFYRDFSFLVSLSKDGADAVVRFAGSAVQATAGEVKTLTGIRVDALAASCIARRVEGKFTEVCEGHSPIAFDLEDNGSGWSGRGILLPFGDVGGDVRFVWGVLAEVSKTVAEATDGTDEAIAGDDKPAEGPIDSERDTGIEPRHQPEPAAEEETVGTLARVIAESQAEAGSIGHIDSRSREALYEVLARALALYQESEKDPEAYARILAAQNIRVQARAPFTPVIKLVFGKDYDKTRITEYAATLSYARRNDQSPEELKDFIMSHAGGIKGCVKAERMAKRMDRGMAGDATLEEANELLRSLPSIGQVVAPDNTGDDEFLILLGRKSESDGAIDVIGVVNEKPGLKDPIIKRAAKALGKSL
jgi:hypothetical protein